MIQEMKTHPAAYVFLVIALVLFVIGFLAAWPNHAVQRMIALAMGTTYTLWGIVTHVKAQYITRRLVMEYLMVGLLASVLLILVTI